MSDVLNIYLDNSATTRICDEALKKYTEVSKSVFGNPSSLHALGLAAEKELDLARRAVLTSVGATDARVIFTASGSEANNLAILGRAFAKERYRRGAKIITTAGEHASVLSPVSRLGELGFNVVQISTRGGKIDTDMLRSEMTPDVILVTVMMVNNETGALYDVAEVARIMRAKAPDALLHVDATQSYMKVPFTKKSIGADMITVSSHKIEGPKGVGALIADEKIFKARGLAPLILGGGQEGGMRSGTENVPAVAAFGEAVGVAMAKREERILKMTELREYLLKKLENTPSLSDISVTLPEKAAPHIINVTLPSIKSETALHYLSSLGIYVSSGSACSSNSKHISSALTAYGRSEEEADSSIRISLSHRNTKEELDALCSGLEAALKKLARKR